MKTRAIIFVIAIAIAIAPTLYEAYFFVYQRLGTQLAVMVALWLVIVISALWFSGAGRKGTEHDHDAVHSNRGHLSPFAQERRNNVHG